MAKWLLQARHRLTFFVMLLTCSVTFDDMLCYPVDILVTLLICSVTFVDMLCYLVANFCHLNDDILCYLVWHVLLPRWHAWTCGVSGGYSTVAFPRVGPLDAVVYPVSSDVTFLRCARPSSPLCLSSFCLFQWVVRYVYTCIMICLLTIAMTFQKSWIKRCGKNY